MGRWWGGLGVLKIVNRVNNCDEIYIFNFL